MSLVVFSFGSFGDIVTLLGLTKRCCQALCESTGASRDYQDLVSELTSFASLLESIQAVIFDSANSNRSMNIAQVRKELELTLKEAKKTLQGFNASILGYKASLGAGGGTGSRVRDSWRKIGWALFKASEVGDMRKKLADYQQKLSLLLGNYQGHGLDDLDDMQRQQEAIVEQLTIHVVRQNQLLAKAPVMPPMDKSITFIGPSGNEFSLPYQFCDSPDLLHRMLRQYYTAIPGTGGGYIFRGDYDITEPGKDASLTTIDLADWRASLRHPGTKIQLTAILYGTELKKMEDAEEGLECPGCKKRIALPEEALEAAKKQSKVQKAKEEADRVKREIEMARRAKFQAEYEREQAMKNGGAVEEVSKEGDEVDQDEDEVLKEGDGASNEEEKVPEVFDKFECPHCHESIPIPAERHLNAAISLTFKPPDPVTYDSSASVTGRPGPPLAIEPAASDDDDAIELTKGPQPPDGPLHLLRHARVLTTMTTKSAMRYFKDGGNHQFLFRTMNAHKGTCGLWEELRKRGGGPMTCHIVTATTRENYHLHMVLSPVSVRNYDYDVLDGFVTINESLLEHWKNLRIQKGMEFRWWEMSMRKPGA